MMMSLGWISYLLLHLISLVSTLMMHAVTSATDVVPIKNQAEGIFNKDIMFPFRGISKNLCVHLRLHHQPSSSFDDILIWSAAFSIDACVNIELKILTSQTRSLSLSVKSVNDSFSTYGSVGLV